MFAARSTTSLMFAILVAFLVAESLQIAVHFSNPEDFSDEFPSVDSQVAPIVQYDYDDINLNQQQLKRLMTSIKEQENKYRPSESSNISTTTTTTTGSTTISPVILETRNTTTLEKNTTDTASHESSQSHEMELMQILRQRIQFYFPEKHSFVSTILIILVATLSVVLYLIFVSWRRHLQNVYGNRECLVRNEVLNESTII